LTLLLLLIAFPLSFLVPIFSPIIILIELLLDAIFDFEMFEVDIEYISFLYVAPLIFALDIVGMLFALDIIGRYIDNNTKLLDIMSRGYKSWNDLILQIATSAERVVSTIQQKASLQYSEASNHRDVVDSDNDRYMDDCDAKLLSCQSQEFANSLPF
jgi:hypothetical protein